jgi:hypothetical protein
MKLVDLTLELYDGFQSHSAHARMPLPIRGATGSPIRAVALLD